MNDRLDRVSRPHAVVAGLSVTIAGLCLLVGLIGQAARLYPRLDLLNQLCPLWLALGAAGSGLAMLAGGTPRRAGVLILGGLIVLGGLLIGPDLARISHSAPTANMLKIVQFNVMKENVEPGRTAEWIAAQKADVVVLEEAADDGGKVARLLAPLYPFSVNCALNDRCSTMILSRQAPLRSQGLAHDDPENRKGLSAVWARFQDAGGPYIVVGVHLMRPWPMGRQQDQLTELVEDLAVLPKPRLIVAGDFNASGWSFDLQSLDRRLGIARRTRLLPTWPARADSPAGRPAPFPILALDQVYAGSGWSTVSVWRGPRLGSDHYPVVVTLTPRTP